MMVGISDGWDAWQTGNEITTPTNPCHANYCCCALANPHQSRHLTGVAMGLHLLDVLEKGVVALAGEVLRRAGRGHHVLHAAGPVPGVQPGLHEGTPGPPGQEGAVRQHDEAKLLRVGHNPPAQPWQSVIRCHEGELEGSGSF